MQTGGDVRIRRGAVPRALAEAETEGPVWQCAGDRLLITFPWGLRFLVEGGERIGYAADGDVDLPSLRLSLLSNAWIALALQRGLLPLHASAVASGAAVHAYTAPSSEGKSTLAAALSARGHAFFADDVLLLDPRRLRRGGAVYGYKDLKLWRHGATLAGVRPGKRVREVVCTHGETMAVFGYDPQETLREMAAAGPSSGTTAAATTRRGCES